MAETPTKEAEDSMKRIVMLNQLRTEAAKQLSDAEEEVKICRKKLVKAERMVFDAINEESTPTLFSTGVTVSAEDLEAGRKALLEEEAKTEAPKSVAGGAVVGGNEEWRKVSVDDLGLPGKIVMALKAHLHNGGPANLDTLGGLADWKAADRWFTDVKGVGKAASEKVDNAIVAYFEAHPVTEAATPDTKVAAEAVATATTDAPPAAESAPEAAAAPAATEPPAKPKRVRKPKVAATK